MKTVNELRLSFIWFEAWPDLLLAPGGAAFAGLGSQTSYAQAIDQLLKGQSPLPGLTLPWADDDTGRSFWTLYLDSPIENQNGDKAWKHLVPLRSALPLKIEAPWLNGRVLGEAFFYPHGVACVITAFCTSDLALTKPLMEVAWQIRRDQKYKLTSPNGPQPPLALEALAQKLMPLLRVQALGKEPAETFKSGRPFSVATVIRGQGVKPNTPVADGDEVHKIAEGITSWNPNWSVQPPPPLANRSLPTNNPSPGNLLYATPHGRLAWLPGCFLEKKAPNAPPPRRMGCYHRNLTLVSLQMESLGTLCRMADQGIAAGNNPAGTYKDLCKRAGEVLGRLHGRATTTYRTASAARQILDNQWKDPINRVRALNQFPPLTP